MAFRLAADADEFVTLAKFRALRLLWARVGEVCGAPARPARVHAESAWRMVTARDPWVNVLRGAMAAFSAGLGGADSVSVLPFTQGLGLPDPFARRLARNAQLILLEESHLGFVADPAAGAGVFEALTAGFVRRGLGRSSRASRRRAASTRRWRAAISSGRSPRPAGRGRATSRAARRR